MRQGHLAFARGPAPEEPICLFLEETFPLLENRIPLDGDNVIGLVTSGRFGYTVKKPIAYGYLPITYSKPGTRLEIEAAAKRYEPTIEKEPLYGPENVRVMS